MSLRSEAVASMENILRERVWFSANDAHYCIDCGARQDHGKPPVDGGWHTEDCRLSALIGKPYGIVTSR